MNDRLHPESLRTLEQLVKLHGEAAIIEAVKTIALRRELRAAGGVTARELAAKLERGNK